MKVIHIIKRIETVDSDIRELRKMEKSLAKNKSFTTPIYMSIEKQINILLGERIKLLELQISNPPKELVEIIEGPGEEAAREVKTEEPAPKPSKKTKKTKASAGPAAAKKKEPDDDDDDDVDIPIMTQDVIDEKFGGIQARHSDTSIFDGDDDEAGAYDDESIKLLDVALEKGTLNRAEIDKEKKKVKFFKDNFPSR